MKKNGLLVVAGTLLVGLIATGCGEEPHVHSYVEHAAINATCHTKGSEAYYSCEGCDKLFNSDKEEIEKVVEVDYIAHHYVDVAAKGVTCEDNGNSAYSYCDGGCEKYFSADHSQEIAKDSWVIAKQGHVYHDVAAVAATCETAGNSAYSYCETEGCGKYFSADHSEEIAKDSWVIAPTGHSYKDVAAVAATCEATGNTAYSYCETAGCGKYFSADHSQEIAANSWVVSETGHHYVDVTAVAATCESAGHTAYSYCDTVGCGKYFSEDHAEEIAEDSWVIAPTGHSYKDVAAVGATCLTGGNTAYSYCETEGCGKYFTADHSATIEKDSWLVNANGHHYVDVAAKDATCEEAGNSAYSYCDAQGCGKYFSEDHSTEITENSWVINAKGHSTTLVKGQAATCENDGWGDYYQCSRCEAYFEDAEATNKIADLAAWKAGSTKVEATGHDWKDHTSGTAFKYEGVRTWKECETCNEIKDDVTHAPWARADFDKATMVSSEHKYNQDHTPTFTKSENEVSFTGYYNGGIRFGIAEESRGRNIVSITLIPSNASWGTCTYLRIYGSDLEKSLVPVTQLYGSGASKWIECGGHIYDANGKEVSTFTKDALQTWEIDVTPYLAEGDKVCAVVLWSGYDADDSAKNFANAPTMTVKDLTFKETNCGHLISSYEDKSVEKVDEYTSSSTWKQCKECNAVMYKKDICPVGKEIVDLNNYISNSGIIRISDNKLISEQEKGATSSVIAYAIPSRFIGKGKLVLRLSLNAVWNGFDIRISKTDGTNLAYNFGQLDKENNVAVETPLNKNFVGVTAVSETGAETWKEGATPLNQVITYTFDLSAGNLVGGQLVKFSLWYGKQTITIDDFYFTDNCNHEGVETTNIVTNKTETEDGVNGVYCNNCGQCVSCTYDYCDKKAVNLPESIVLGNQPGAEVYFKNIIEHTSTRTKLVIKMSFEVETDGVWAYTSGNYGTYINFLKKDNSGLELGLYEGNKTTQTTFIQMNSGSGRDARKLRTSTTEDTASYIMPSFITTSFSSGVITWEIDLTNSITNDLYGFSFRNSTANSRLHILEAYQTK